MRSKINLEQGTSPKFDSDTDLRGLKNGLRRRKQSLVLNMTTSVTDIKNELLT